MRIQSLLYATLNPPVRALLRSPLHGIASSNLCLLSYRGRRTGRHYTTPLSFTREGRLVRLLTSHNTHWWRNFVGGSAPVEIEIARVSHHGTAIATTQDGERFRNGIRAFLTALPRDAPVYRIRLDRARRPSEDDIANAAGHVVLVEVELQT
jgi:hypothetical protein